MNETFQEVLHQLYDAWRDTMQTQPETEQIYIDAEEYLRTGHTPYYAIGTL